MTPLFIAENDHSTLGNGQKCLKFSPIWLRRPLQGRLKRQVPVLLQPGSPRVLVQRLPALRLRCCGCAGNLDLGLGLQVVELLFQVLLRQLLRQGAP